MSVILALGMIMTVMRITVWSRFESSHIVWTLADAAMWVDQNLWQ